MSQSEHHPSSSPAIALHTVIVAPCAATMRFPLGLVATAQTGAPGCFKVMTSDPSCHRGA